MESDEKLIDLLPSSWKVYMNPDFLFTHFEKIEFFLKNQPQNQMIFPEKGKIFSAFDFCAPWQVRVVILGQDPYHGRGQAHGLSFSVPQGVKLPPSLQNIFKELENDLGIRNTIGNLEPWAKQGVFLLNSVLTVREGCPTSHANIGWEEFTNLVIKILNDYFEGIIFVLWGMYAQSKQGLINTSKHTIIKAPHPSPFSAHKGFFGSKPFSKINSRLLQLGKQPIDWRIV